MDSVFIIFLIGFSLYYLFNWIHLYKLAKGAANITVSSGTTAKNIAVHGGEKAYDVVAPLVGLKKTDASNAAQSIIIDILEIS